MTAQPALWDDAPTAPEWAPIFEDRLPEDLRDAGNAGRLDWWDTWSREHPRRCRDCGGLMSRRPWSHGCGGADGGGSYSVCDDCAKLDGIGQRSDGAKDCSHWGIHSTPEERVRLRAEQAKRRHSYLRTHGRS